MASVTYGKSIMSSVIMAKILWQMKLSQYVTPRVPKGSLKNLFSPVVWPAIANIYTNMQLCI